MGLAAGHVSVSRRAWLQPLAGTRRIAAVEDAFLRFLGITDPRARRELVEQTLLEEMRVAASVSEDRRDALHDEPESGPKMLALSRDPERRGLVIAVAPPAEGAGNEN